MNVQVMEKLGNKDVITVFPTLKKNVTTRILLKKPKTSSSVRKIWLPKMLAYILLNLEKKTG